jgi:hypothetical protein
VKDKKCSEKTHNPLAGLQFIGLLRRRAPRNDIRPFEIVP